MGYIWRSKDKYINDVLQWTPSYGRARLGWPAGTYQQQLCTDPGYSKKDITGAIDDGDEWREKVMEIRASNMTWWWWNPEKRLSDEGMQFDLENKQESHTEKKIACKR